MDMTKPLPPGITVVSNGFRYKGKPWPGKGDICLKCRGHMCESLLSGFGKQTPYVWCVACKRGVLQKNRSTFEGYLSYICSQMLSRCKTTNRECTIDLKFIKDLWYTQKGRCALSGLQMLHTYSRDVPERVILNASVDRIDSSGGYTPGNVQLVSVRVNLMKGPLTENSFYDLCHAIVRNRVCD